MNESSFEILKVPGMTSRQLPGPLHTHHANFSLHFPQGTFEVLNSTREFCLGCFLYCMAPGSLPSSMADDHHQDAAPVPAAGIVGICELDNLLNIVLLGLCLHTKQESFILMKHHDDYGSKL